MQAIQVSEFGGPEVLKVRDLPDPVAGPGQVLVDVRAVGINPVETYIRAGVYPVLPELPFVPGHDAAGVVEAVGEGVTHVRPGDRVYTAGTLTGAYAAKTLANAGTVHRLPDNVSFEQGAAVGVPYTTAYRALFQRAQARPGETVMVHGATGGVGIAAVQLCRAAGMRVIATGGSEAGRQLVSRFGADVVLDHGEADYLSRIPELTGGAGVDVILEMLANVNLGRDLGVLARKGRVVVIGSRGTVEINPRDTMGRDAAILGMALPNASPEEYASIHAALGAGLANGTLVPEVAARLKLDQAAQAHEQVMQAGARGKIVLTCD